MIRDKSIELSSQVISGEFEVDTKGIPLNQSEMIFNFQFNNGSQFGMPEEFGISFSNENGEVLNLGYIPGEKIFFVDRTDAGRTDFSDNFAGIHTAPFDAGEGMKIQLFMDASSLEVFVDNGKLVMTDIVFPTKPYNSLKIFTKNGNVKLDNSHLRSLESIW